MLNEELVKKLEAWVDAHPEEADTPYMNVTLKTEMTLRNLVNMAKASLAGEVQLDPKLEEELTNLETWVGGL